MKRTTQEEDTQPVPTQGSSDSLAQASDASKSQRAEERDLSFAERTSDFRRRGLREGLRGTGKHLHLWRHPLRSWNQGDTISFFGLDTKLQIPRDTLALKQPGRDHKTDRFKDAERPREATPCAHNG